MPTEDLVAVRYRDEVMNGAGSACLGSDDTQKNGKAVKRLGELMKHAQTHIDLHVISDI